MKLKPLIAPIFATSLLACSATVERKAPVGPDRGIPLEVEHYNPRELATQIEKLRSTGGRHLVVGHSNTTPAAVRLLGGDGGSPIRNMEYDRLYAVTVSPQGETTSVVLRYGEVLD